jgi:acyl-CoA dehydrogenase
MAAGRLTLSVAISEPGVGAHPKHLRATAERSADGWRLTGEKTFLTNGPIAGLFVVVACSGMRDGRKQFSAFLVPRDCPGLTEVAMRPLGFLQSSPHCGIRLDGCEVAAEALLGEEGTAFAALSLPLRHVEDTLGASLNAGAMRHELTRLAAASAALESLPENAAEQLGALAGLLAGLDCLADAAVADLDHGLAEDPLAAARSVGFRTLAQHFQRLAGSYAAAIGGESDAVTAGLLRDIDRSLDIAKSARLVKQSRLGLRLLNHGG